MNLSLKSKLLITIGVVFILSFGAVAYYDYQSARDDIIADLTREARSMRTMMAATRKVYRQQFIASGIPLNDKTVGFLPAHALNRISDQFKKWMESGLTFNNVSDRPRNPAQAADSVELEAMDYFRNSPGEKERVVYYTDEQGRGFYHFASPMWITKDCLKCHGKKEDAPHHCRTCMTVLSDTSWAIYAVSSVLNCPPPSWNSGWRKICTTL